MLTTLCTPAAVSHSVSWVIHVLITKKGRMLPQYSFSEGSTVKTCSLAHALPVPSREEGRAEGGLKLKGADGLRAGLQLTAESDRLSHIHRVEVCGVATSGPPLPQIHSFLPIRTGLSSHF